MASKQTKDTPHSSAKRASGRGGARQAQRPLHREIGAIVCLFLAVFVVLGCFGVTAFFIDVLAGLIRGLVGTVGFYLMPLALTAAFLILLLHRGRPVRLRLASIFFLTLSVSALGYLFTQAHYGWGTFFNFYRYGVNGGACGLVSGFLALLLETIFSRIGAVLLFLILTLLALLYAADMTVSSLIRAIRERPRLPKYDEPEEPPVDRAKQLVDHVQNRRIERVEQRRRIADFDLPVEDAPGPVRARSTKRPPAAAPIEPPLEQLPEQPREEREEREEGAREPLESIGEVREQPPEKLEVVPPAAPLRGPVEEPDLELMPKAPSPARQSAHPAAQDQDPAPLELVAQEIGASVPLAEEYVYPPVDLLHPSQGGSVDGTEEMRENTERLNETLQSFNIDAHIVNVIRGPSVTRYELELDRGVKLSKITNLADDIALSLGASGVRISAIPDKISVVGIEVPNRLVSAVLIRDVIDSPEFSESKSKISFAVGKDIGGNRIVGDIAKLPHMLIAGTTGSGKSVCMNSLIISLLFKSRPDEVRLIMVDPKMVELGVYNGIPHLLIPVVTDPKKAAGALQWAVTEMMRRYRLMADAGVRDLSSYNHQAQSGGEERTLEQIVVVIDELADLMLVAAKDVEESICRIAQMGRASGIHLVIATQRPSADVITGLMKANIPSRIAFAVASGIESRIILDTQGAEKLVGKGDMLYAPLGQGKPKRVQGCFITDGEVQEVVRFIKQTSTPNYSQEVQSQIEEGGGKNTNGGGSTAAQEQSSGSDELLPAAVDVILETGQASVSMLQRRLKLGYARAARIVDEMEQRGIVGPFEGSKPRQLLITREEWELQKRGGAAETPEERTAPPVDQ